MKQGKIWGTTELIFRNENCEIHRLEVKAGFKCSKHKHEFKHNIFFVESGRMDITVWKKDYELTDVTTLHPGEKTDVSPNEFHQFKCIKDAVVLEIYYSEPINNDIIRDGVGGPVKQG